MDDLQLQRVLVHGHERAYLRIGEGPALLLLHGLGCDSSTWLPVLPMLAKNFTVIAPDLLGHGRSGKPRSDYSLAGFANGMRDLLTVLQIEHATVVGHSMGGGVAIQFAYQFPELADRLVLVTSGGFGHEVSWVVRGLTVPGAGTALGAASMWPWRPVVAGGLRLLARTGVRHVRDLGEVADVYEGLADPQARAAVRHVVRSAVDWRGQIVNMTDRTYLSEVLPVCIIWGADDLVFPVTHAHRADELAPGAEVHVLDDSSHFPHKDHPALVADLITDFVGRTSPGTRHRAKFRKLLRNGVAAQVRDLPAVER
ncbi:alpha/beta hydrolase [soil metagenome]